MAASFIVFVRCPGEVEGVEVEVAPDTTIRDIKVRLNLKGHQLYFKQAWKDASLVSELGIQAGQCIAATKTALQTPQRQAALRINNGRGKQSTQHRHLHAQTTATVVGAVMAESDKLSGEVADVSKQIDALNAQAQGDHTTAARRQGRR